VVTLQVAAGIIDRGERPFLHLAASNTAAMAVYERIGFEVRTAVGFGVYRPRGADIEADA
jgi:predicted GNAT family acetyltransferase